MAYLPQFSFRHLYVDETDRTKSRTEITLDGVKALIFWDYNAKRIYNDSELTDWWISLALVKLGRKDDAIAFLIERGARGGASFWDEYGNPIGDTRNARGKMLDEIKLMV